MKISYNWLKEILDFPLDPIKTSELLTDIGLEVERTESYENIKGGLANLLVGEVLSVEKHANADRLNLTKVNLGDGESHQIICGALNIKKGQKVVVAKPGVTIFPKNGEAFKIKKAKIRGEDSFGMICAEDEIGVGDNRDGIIVLNKSSKIGDLVSNYFDVKKDIIFEIGLTPNRSDAMSHYGVARDLLAALKFKKLISLNATLKKLPIENQQYENTGSNVEIIIENPNECHRYSGIVLKNIDVQPSPNWLKEKLESVGLKPINNIVDITNYVLHYYGQPLHAFDYDHIKGKKIVVRNPKKDTLFTTLDGVERKLHENDIMICDSAKEMCIGGVFGGKDSGVTEKTKNIFIESALFNPVSIRKTAKRHGLNTDASFRYERGVDSKMVLPALFKACELVLEISNGKIDSPLLDVFPKKETDFKININFDNIRKIGGFNITDEEIVSILNFLDITIEKLAAPLASISVPSYRTDVQREIDITEELMRIYGYNNIEIPNKINSSPSAPLFKSKHLQQQKISNHLVSLGFFEIMNNSLTKKSYQDKQQGSVELLNPLSKDNSVLRKTLIFGALETMKYNHFNGSSNNKFFEWGRTYLSNTKNFQESNDLILAVSGLQNKEHWYNGKSQSNFFQLKGVLESIFNSFGILYNFENISQDKYYSEGLIFVNKDKTLAKIGLLKKEVLSQVGIKAPCFISEIFFDNFISNTENTENKIKAVNKFQKSFRDFSILIDEEITMNEMVLSIKKINNSILKSVSLFDIFRDKKLADKKSYGLRFEFLHPERTLKDEEVDRVMVAIQDKMKEEFNAVLR